MREPRSSRYLLKGIVSIILLFGVVSGFWFASWNPGRWGFREWNLATFFPLVFCNFYCSSFLSSSFIKTSLQWISGVLAVISGASIYWMFHN
jgi:hypothetical protein